MSKVWILESGGYYSDCTETIAVSKSKAALIRWIKANKPGFKFAKSESLWSNDELQEYLRIESQAEFV